MCPARLPDGVLLNIYFLVDDYNALSQFPLLSKDVYILITRYKSTTQMHRMTVLKRNLFDYLDGLVCEDDVFHNKYPHCDLIRLYNLYKKGLTSTLMSLFPLRYVLLASDEIANMILVSGEENVKKLVQPSVYIPVDSGSSCIKVCLVQRYKHNDYDEAKDYIFDVLRNSKYKFNQINFKYITRIFDSVFNFN